MRRRRVRGVRDPGRSARPRRRHDVDRRQRLPCSRRSARRAGDRHRRGAGVAGCDAPGPGEHGARGRFAVRILHARLRVQHGRRVLSPGPERGGAGRRRPRARPERVRPARTQRQPVPLHRLPPDSRCGVLARRSRGGRRRRIAARSPRTGSGPHRSSERGRPIRASGQPRRCALAAGGESRGGRGGRIDRLGGRRQHPRSSGASRGGRRPRPRAAGARLRRRLRRDRRRPSRCRRPSSSSPVASRCSRSCSRSSPRG